MCFDQSFPLSWELWCKSSFTIFTNRFKSIKCNAISRFCREYTKMTTDGIRTHAAMNFERRNFWSHDNLYRGGRPLPFGHSSRVLDWAISHICVKAFKPLTTSFLLLYVCMNDFGSQSISWLWNTVFSKMWRGDLRIFLASIITLHVPHFLAEKTSSKRSSAFKESLVVGLHGCVLSLARLD